MPPQKIQEFLCHFCFLRLFDSYGGLKVWTQSALKGRWRLSQVPIMTWFVCLLCGGNPEKGTDDVLSPIGQRRQRSIPARYQLKAETIYISIVFRQFCGNCPQFVSSASLSSRAICFSSLDPSQPPAGDLFSFAWFCLLQSSFTQPFYFIISLKLN